MTATTSRNGQQSRAITAASKRLPVQGEGGGPSAKRTDSSWQDEAWSYFDDVPEVKFAARFLGSSLSRLRLFPAIVINPDDPPIALADAVGVEGSPITADLARAADEEFARLGSGTEGMAGLQREFGICLTIAGEANLVGRETADGEEEWRVYSESALTKASSGKLAIKETPGAQPEELGEDDFVARVWRRHARWPGLADSNMRSILDACEELLIYGRQFRAVGRSRNNAGILTLPNGLDFAAERVVIEDPDGTGPIEEQSDEDDLTPLERGIVESMVTPTADDGSASQVVPHFLRGPLAELAGVRHIPLDRKIDEQAIARMVHLISRMANGLDVPVEVLTGVADANHWTAWQIEDATYKAHVEPLAQIPAQALAAVFLRPALLAAGFAAELVKRIVIGIDPSELVVRPNRGADAKDAFDRDALSWDALRQYLGFSEADKPSSDELLLRYTLDRSIGGMSLTRDLFNLVGFDDVPDAAESAGAETEAKVEAGSGGDGAPAPAAPAEEGGPPTPAEPEEPASATRRALSAMLAAATGSSQLGERLGAIDARLRDRVQIAASEALTAALARAGARLRSIAQGDPKLAELVKGQPNSSVGEILGQAGATLPAGEDLLGEQDFAQLGERFAAWVEQARREALDVARRDAGAHGVDGEEFSRLAGSELGDSDDDDREGWLLLLGALLTLGRSRILTPDGTPDDGEFDPQMAVPPGPVREALARAGGALGETGAPSATGAGAASGGPATGTRMLRLIARTGAVQVAWRWDVGMPAVPFPPHHALSGLIFRSWDDASLTNAGGFPSRAYFYPGDHKGCQCDAVPVLVYSEGGGLDAPSSAVPGFGTAALAP